jgi:hypothetical protein
LTSDSSSKEHPPTPRLQDAAKFNALFTHRVRLASTDDIDTEIRTWLQRAYDQAARRNTTGGRGPS